MAIRIRSLIFVQGIEKLKQNPSELERIIKNHIVRGKVSPVWPKLCKSIRPDFQADGVKKADIRADGPKEMETEKFCFQRNASTFSALGFKILKYGSNQITNLFPHSSLTAYVRRLSVTPPACCVSFFDLLPTKTRRGNFSI